MFRNDIFQPVIGKSLLLASSLMMPHAVNAVVFSGEATAHVDQSEFQHI